MSGAAGRQKSACVSNNPLRPRRVRLMRPTAGQVNFCLISRNPYAAKGALDGGVPNVACRLKEMAMSPVAVSENFLSILR